MKGEVVVAKRYAESLHEAIGSKLKDVDSALTDLVDLCAVWNESDDLRYALENPLVSEVDKLAILDALHKKMKISKKVGNLFKLLAKGGRAGLLSKVAREYELVSDEVLGRAHAKVVSAKDLSDSDKTKLAKNLEKGLGLSLELSYETNSALLGGYTVEVSGKIFDFSVKSQLDGLQDIITTMRVR